MLLLFAAATFAGNAACAGCHAVIVRQYEQTPMARSTGKIANNVPPGTFLHNASKTEYAITAAGDVRIRRGGTTEDRRFDYVIGSGAAGFSYIIARAGYLFQAPITWYTQAKRWDASPGYQNDTGMAWDRPIEPSCLLCHASQVTPVYGSLNKYVDPPFKQNGVACERCHGAGSEHIASAGTGSRVKMVIPSKLDSERRDDVCRQCHLMGEARIPREGHVFAEYRAGARLGDYVAYFVTDDPDGPALRTTSHVEKLNASRCKQSSGDRLWCGTCHDTHTTPIAPAAWYREKCRSCHEPRTCKRGDNCIACHMPKSQAVDAGHGAFTDHAIPRQARRPAAVPADAWRLRPFSKADLGDRELALAYAELYGRTGDERQKREFLRLTGQR